MTHRSSGFRMLSGRTNRRRFVGGSALAAASLSLPIRYAGAQGTEVTWSSWGNTGEVENFKNFTEQFNSSQSEVVAEFIPVPTDGYDEKLLTQLNGGTAPDLFYVSDGQVATLIDNQVVADLTERLSSEASMSKPEDFAGDLWGPAQTPDGKIYGVPVDCNPLVIWYNKSLLQEAGITEMPADTYEAGNWNWDTFQNILDTVSESGRRGLVLGDWWAYRYSFITNNGGSIYADGRFVANEDEKSIEAIQWLADNIAAEKIIFSGSLPEGQGADAMFMSNQLAFVSLGRWGLPLFRQNEQLDCDIVPYPTNTGNKIEPSGVAVAYWCMNANPSADPDAAFNWYTYFVSPEGQRLRLDEGGNAVPSIEGAEDVVLSDSLPEHKQYFLDARDIGYGPLAEEAGTPGLSSDLNDLFAEFWLEPGDAKTILDAAAEMANTAMDEAAG